MGHFGYNINYYLTHPQDFSGSYFTETQDKFMPGTSEQTAKISKTGFTKVGHTAVSKPKWFGF